MNKTIEEAERRLCTELELRQAVNDALSAYMDKPLRDRMTEAEKESIKQIYKHHLNAIGDCYTHSMVRAELERIFGKEMFNENKKE